METVREILGTARALGRVRPVGKVPALKVGARRWRWGVMSGVAAMVVAGVFAAGMMWPRVSAAEELAQATTATAAWRGWVKITVKETGRAKSLPDDVWYFNEVTKASAMYHHDNDGELIVKYVSPEKGTVAEYEGYFHRVTVYGAELRSPSGPPFYLVDAEETLKQLSRNGEAGYALSKRQEGAADVYRIAPPAVLDGADGKGGGAGRMGVLKEITVRVGRGDRRIERIGMDYVIGGKAEGLEMVYAYVDAGPRDVFEAGAPRDAEVAVVTGTTTQGAASRPVEAASRPEGQRLSMEGLLVLRVDIVGNAQVDEERVKGRLTVKAGHPYVRADADQDVMALSKLGAFSGVQAEAMTVSDPLTKAVTGVVVRYVVTEKAGGK